MDANQQRPTPRTRIAELENHSLFRFVLTHAFEAEYAESSEAARKVRFSDFI
jgi:hypothetical protein